MAHNTLDSLMNEQERVLKSAEQQAPNGRQVPRIVLRELDREFKITQVTNKFIKIIAYSMAAIVLAALIFLRGELDKLGTPIYWTIGAAAFLGTIFIVFYTSRMEAKLDRHKIRIKDNGNPTDLTSSRE